LSNKISQAVLDATKDGFADLPARLCISMTYDNGKKFSKHENTNSLLRQLIPKGTDFDTVSDDDLAKYVDLINNRPRKRLNWLSPNQVFDRELNSVVLETGI
jgi:IS30 family transposase